MPALITIPGETLRELYINQRLSPRKIAKILGYAYSTIDKKIHLAKLPIRNLAQSHIIYPQSDFDGNAKEKAYLIGLRIGDLRVRKFYKNSETLIIDCASTKEDQINLISNIFSPYGRVWISKPNKRGCRQIQCHVNMTFDFLVAKEEARWIYDDKLTFFSFLAGFIDAEGSVFISRNHAVLSIGNYNLHLLSKIKSVLLKYVILSHKITRSRRQGLIASHGYRYNHDYWTLVVSRKADLYKLLTFLSPYLKHENKIRRLGLAIRNIEERNKIYGKK